MVEGIKDSGRLGVVGRRYAMSDEEDKRKTEAVVFYLYKFNYTPLNFIK